VHQPHRRSSVPPALNQHVEDFALVVDRGRRCRSLRAIKGPNFNDQRCTISLEMSSPRSARRSTSR
jgi:hypothetical protein